MDKYTLGLVGLVSFFWSLAVAATMYLMKVDPFAGTGVPLWFAAVFTPLFLVGFLNWTHRIRFLWYAAMLTWGIQLMGGNRQFIFFIAAGWPIAGLYEFMFRQRTRRAVSSESQGDKVGGG